VTPLSSRDVNEMNFSYGSSFPVTGASLPCQLYPRIAVEVAALPRLSD
jgi:hypothetical protein